MSQREPIFVVGDSHARNLVTANQSYGSSLGQDLLRLEPLLAIGGFTSRDLKSTLKQNRTDIVRKLSEFKPPIILLCVGTNDIFKNKSNSLVAVKNNFRSLIQFLFRINQSSRLIILSVFKSPVLLDRPHLKRDLIDFNKYLYSFSSAKVTLLDINEKLCQSPLDFFQQRYLSGRPDRLHLSPKGNALLLQEISHVGQALSGT